MGGDGFVEGEATEIKATGSVTTVAEGEVTNTIVYTEGANFNADNYDISKSEGTLKITENEQELKVESSTKSWKYDGQTHTDEVYTVTFGDQSGTAVKGEDGTYTYTITYGEGESQVTDTVTITPTAEGVKDYDESYSKNNTFTATVTNESSYKTFTKEFGTLSIDKRTVTLKSGNAEKVYNGEALTNADVEGKNENGLVEETGWVDGEGATYSFSGTQTLVGGSPNAFTYTLNESTKADNYTIKKTPGTLKVTDENVPADLVVTKTTTQSEVKLGDQVTFTITATNIYAEPKTITLSEIDDVTLSKSTFENVAAGDSIEATATYTITAADVLNGKFKNTVTAKIDDLTKTAEATVTTEGKNPHMTITKETTSTTPEGGYPLGSTISYKITATNDGNVELTDIIVTDELTGGNWTIASLAPKASKEFETSYVVKEADILAGEVLNVATGTGKGPDPDDPPTIVPGKDPEPTEDIDVTLTVNKKITNTPEDGKAFKLGETIKYSIDVTNAGNVPYTKVKVEDKDTKFSDTIAELGVDETKSFTTSHVVTEADILAGSYTNTVTAKGDKIDDPKNPGQKLTPEGKDSVTTGDANDPDGPTPPIEDQKPGLSVTKKASPTSGAAAGSTINYVVRVTNIGNVTLKNVTVSDTLVRFANNSGNIKSLAPGAYTELRYPYTVTEANAAAGRVVNTASATASAPNGDKPSDRATVTVATVAPTPTPPGPTPTPTPAPAPTPDGGGNVVPVTPADDGTVIPDEPVPEVEPEVDIVDPEPPLAEGTWALLNLISAIVTALGAVIALFRKKEEEDENDEDNMYKEEDEDDNRSKKMLAAKIAGALAGVAAPITFFLTEDMSLPMAMFDKWTVLMAAMLAVQVVAAVFNKKASELPDEEEGAEETAN